MPLCETVFGHPVVAEPAWIEDRAARQALNAEGHPLSFPVLVPEPGARTEGVLVALSAEDRKKLAFYELGYDPVSLPVHRASGGTLSALVEIAPEEGAEFRAGPPWDFAEWRDRWAEIVTEAAPEFLSLQGRVAPAIAHERYPMILVRAASRLRAQREPSPAVLRRDAVPGDVEVERLSEGYVKFFAVEDYRLRFRRFSGAMSRPLERAAFISGDATAVLPYDPVRDRVLLVEQFRMGPFGRGAPNPWQIEAIAGRVDPDESPEETARREAGEEAGITLHDLLPASRFYASSGAKTEYVYCFVALSDLPDDCARPGGLEEEGEDIRPHLLSFDGLMKLLETGEAENGPLVVLALWLALRRPSLRAAAGVAPEPADLP